MGWIVLLGGCILIGAVIGYLVSYEDCESAVLGGVFGLLSATIILMCAAFGNISTDIIKEEEVVQYNIQGLENNTDSKSYINGAFILGCGGFNGETSDTLNYYFFMVDENGKKLQKLDGTDVYIRETNEHEPCYIIKIQTLKTDGFKKWLFGTGEFQKEAAKILVVPENTIKIDYNIDI